MQPCGSSKRCGYERLCKTQETDRAGGSGLGELSSFPERTTQVPQQTKSIACCGAIYGGLRHQSLQAERCKLSKIFPKDTGLAEVTLATGQGLKSSESYCLIPLVRGLCIKWFSAVSGMKWWRRGYEILIEWVLLVDHRTAFLITLLRWFALVAKRGLRVGISLASTCSVLR